MLGTMMKLCLIEDDLLLGRGLKASMEDAGHQVTWLRMARDASAWLTSPDYDFDAVVLDLGLPDGEGMDILRLLRQQDKKMATVIITARDTLDQRLDGLDAGADDYLVKPFDNSELLARLRAVMRRSSDSMTSDALLRAGEVSIDEQRMLAHRRQEIVNLSPTEFSLLRELLRHKNRVRTRRQLEAQAMPGSEGQSLDVHISNLRRKIGGDLIRTVRGVGYVVDDNQD
jgi:two-component system response regulator QseB/two-component system response regulator BasR